jgi:hypothetical protein
MWNLNRRMEMKPAARVIGENGNVYNVLGICARAPRDVGLAEQAEEMKERVFKSSSYDEALCIMMDYVEME